VKISLFATFKAVLDKGTLSAAADEIGLTASAVSLQIKQLEEYFGQPLFDRSGRRAQPTPFAREVAAAIQDAFATIESLRASKTLSVAGRARLGVITSAQSAALPRALKFAREHFPALAIQIITASSENLLSELKAGRIDACVLVRPESGGSSRLAWYNLMREPFVLIAPPDATGRTIAELLRTHDWIRYDPSTTGGRIAARYVQRVAPRSRPSCDMLSTDVIVAMVSAGLGVSVLPQPRAQLHAGYPLRQLSLGKNGPTRQVAFVCRQADAGNRRLLAVRDAFAEAYAQG
jgi:DNA-binding transcriptional LysR family regulator